MRGVGKLKHALLDDFDAVFFDDGVGQDFVSDGLDLLAGLLPGGAGSEGDIEKFTLPDVGYRGITEVVKLGADGGSLRVQDRGLEGDKHASFHEETRLSHGAAIFGENGRERATIEQKQ